MGSTSLRLFIFFATFAAGIHFGMFNPPPFLWRTDPSPQKFKVLVAAAGQEPWIVRLDALTSTTAELALSCWDVAHLASPATARPEDARFASRADVHVVADSADPAASDRALDAFERACEGDFATGAGEHWGAFRLTLYLDD